MGPVVHHVLSTAERPNRLSRAIAGRQSQNAAPASVPGSALEVDLGNCVVASGDGNEQSVERVESPTPGSRIFIIEHMRDAGTPVPMDPHPNAGVGFDVLDVVGLMTLCANQPEAVAGPQSSTDWRLAEQPGRAAVSMTAQPLA